MSNPRTSPASPRFQVHADRTVDWLPASRTEPGVQPQGLDARFRADADDLHDEIQILATYANDDGVLALADHHLELWQVADEGFLLTLDPPTGPRLCSQHLSIRDLLPDTAVGATAMFAVLDAIARIANGLLDQRDRGVGRAHLPAPRHVSASALPPAPPPDGPATNPAGPSRPHRR